MSALEGKWIDVFRAGDYGDKGTYSRAVLEKIAAAYDPKVHEAPVTVGHPEANGPAYGWVEALRVGGNGTATLEAKLRQVDQGFEDLVKAGRFKKRSVAFYNDLGGRGIYLRHLGFLGAQPPEVKGLNDLRLCEFRDDSAFTEYVEIEEKPVAPKTVSELEMLMRVNAASKAAREVSERELANLQARIEAEAKRKEGIRACMKTLKPLAERFPAFRMPGLGEFMESLSDVEYIEFGEGENREIKSPREIFTAFLEMLPWIVCGRRPAARKV